MPETATSNLRSDRARTLGRDLSHWLQTAMASVSAEIRGYPTPIPRCDDQFNHLMAQRNQIALVMGELDLALEGGDAAALRSVLERFGSLPPLGESAAERGLRARVAAEFETA